MSDITLFNFESDYCCQRDLNNWDGMILVDEKWNYWDGMTLVDEKWNPYENAHLIDRLIIAEFYVSDDKRNNQQYNEVKANRPDSSKQDTGIMGNHNDYDFTRPGAEDGLPAVQHRDRKDTNNNDRHRKNMPTPGEFCSADGIIYQEKLWVPLMNAMQASIDLAYECDQIPEEKTALDEVISLLMLSSPPTALLVSQISTLVKLYSKRTRLLPSQLKEENILRAVRSCASNIHWQRAAGGYYDCGNTGKKPFTMMYTDGVSGANPLGVPTVMVSFPGMCFSRVEDWVNILSGFAKELPGTGIFGHKGFVTSAISVEPQLEAFLKELNLTPGSYQIVFCGHSMGGAVAALSAISYATKHPVVEKNNVLVYTMGQPKTIKDGYADTVDALILPQNHIRMLAYSGSVCDPDLPESLHQTPTSDFVGGYLESRVDTIRCCHVGTEYPLTATVALPYGRLSLHVTSTYWSAMHSNARSRFDDASVVYHHSGKFTNVALDAVDPVDAVISAGPVVKVNGAADISVSTIGALHDTNPTNTTTAATNTHTITSTDSPTTTNCSFNTSSNANTPSGEHDSCQMWSCCSSPFADESGCVRGVQTQHAGEWDWSESYWTCCQTAGTGLRYVSGCSIPFALQVLTESQAKYNQMAAVYSEEVYKCHRLQKEVERREYAGDSVSKRDEALYAMSQRECLRLNTATKAADIALNEAYYSWTRATLLAEMQTVSGEKSSVVDQKMHAHTIDSTGSLPGSAHFLDAIDAAKRLQQRLHLVALLFTHKAALDRAEDESTKVSRDLQRASSCATECSAVLTAHQKTVQSSRALMVARVAAVEAVRVANWEVQIAKQFVRIASDKVSHLRKSFNAAVDALNANRKAESLGDVRNIGTTASDHRVAVEIAKRVLDYAQVEVVNVHKACQDANTVYLAAVKELNVCSRLRCRNVAETQRKYRAVAAQKCARNKCIEVGKRSQEASDRKTEAQRVYDAAVAAELVFNK